MTHWLTARTTVALAALVALTVFAAGGAGGPAGPRQDAAVAVVNTTVIPMTSPETVLREHTVVVRGDRIVEVGTAADVQVPAGARVVDGRGKYLVPGLVDFHVHLRDARELDEYLRHGVTTVVSMRATETTMALRERVRSGAIAGPGILTAGPLVDGDPPIWRGAATTIVTTSADAVAVAETHCREGYDFLKVYNNLQPALLPELVSRAHACGIPVAAHLPRVPVREEGLARGLAAGIDLIAHAEEIFFTHLGGASDALLQPQASVDPERLDDAVRRIAAANAAVVPTLSFVAMTARMLDDVDAVFRDPRFNRLAPDVQQMWREQNPTRRSNLGAFTARERVKRDAVAALTRKLQAAGVLLLAGTDASAPGLYPGASLHLEIEELAASGLTPFQALAAATRNAGRFFAAHPPGSGRADLRALARLGTIQGGAPADLVLLAGNPLEDLRQLSRLEGVMTRGRWRAIGSGQPRSRRQVAITIDDVPRGGDGGSRRPADIAAMTRRLLRPFDARIPVTGFVNAGQADAWAPAALRALLDLWLDAGADLGNHSHSHLNINVVGLDEYAKDIARGEPPIRDALAARGRTLTWYRHPFLFTGPTPEIKASLQAFLDGRGYRVAPVTIDNSDYMFAALYANATHRERVAREYVPYMESVVAFFEARAVELAGREFPQILLLHANELNADLLPDLLTMFRRRGYTFVSLEHALEDEAYRLPDAYAGKGGFSWIHRWSRTMGLPPKGEPDPPQWVQDAWAAR